MSAPGNALVNRLSRFLDLSSRERIFLLDMQRDCQKFIAGTDILSAGRRYDGIFVLNRGSAFRYKVLRDGRRQILNLILPGDFIGFPGCLFDSALYSVATLGECEACSVSFSAVFDVFRRHPRLAAAFFWQVGHESALFAEHLVGVGRQSAYERVAHLLLEFLVRLRIAGLADERSYVLPLTQEMMADALGLSVPHVNRTLRKLREDGMISLEGSQLTCLDIEGLSRLADFDGLKFTSHKIPNL